MIKIKHLMDDWEADDGQRLWVESVGLTRDLREWCKIDHILPHLGPAGELSEWFEQHPDGYDFFLRLGPLRNIDPALFGTQAGVTPSPRGRARAASMRASGSLATSSDSLVSTRAERATSSVSDGLSATAARASKDARRQRAK